MTNLRTYKHRGVTLVDLRSRDHLVQDEKAARAAAEKQVYLDARPILFEDTSHYLNHSPSGSALALAAYGAMA